jgi:hypothetical protein
MSQFSDRLRYAWSHPIDTFRNSWTAKVGMVNTVMFGGLEVVDAASTALGENRLLDFAWESVVFLGAVANASYVLARKTEIPNSEIA